ncbi:MAG: GDP-L-fucose synthetase [Chlamydiales bacterium]|jgi:GDP-L-fucose synthase|nr:GDP-L-fucose synthetase [Chlamydiales bacterium]
MSNNPPNFYKDKKILVTGGSGFIGSNFIKSLLLQGAYVRTSFHQRPVAIKHERLEIVTADLTCLDDCLRITEGMQYVVHAGGAVAAVCVGKTALMHVINLNLTLFSNMLEAAWEKQVERFLVFGSSTGYPATDHPVQEDELWSAPPHPSYFGYGWMRRYMEKLAEFVASKSNMKIAIVRPTAVYGPGDDFDLATCHVIPALIRKAIDRVDPFEVWGTGEEIRDLLYVDDFIRGSLLALEKHVICDPINIGYGEGTSIRSVLQLILKATQYTEAKVIFNSDRPVAIPKRIVSIEKAKSLLNFFPQINLEQGLAATVNSYKQIIANNGIH